MNPLLNGNWMYQAINSKNMIFIFFFYYIGFIKLALIYIYFFQ